MSPEQGATVYLDTFDAPVARAVVQVLTDHGIAAWTKSAGSGLPGLGRDESAVFVPAGRREEAFAVLAADMEAVHELAASEPRLVQPRGLGAPRSDLEDEDGPPIVMERFRRMGFVGLLLAPLLVVTLAGPGMPLVFGLVLYVAGLVAITAWRNRADEPQ